MLLLLSADFFSQKIVQNSLNPEQNRVLTVCTVFDQQIIRVVTSKERVKANSSFFELILNITSVVTVT